MLDCESIFLSSLTLTTGGAGEAAKLKGLKSQAEVKTDAILPAYCNPPNPCPVGQTAEDGCIENFENTAAFSRAYQASQECMCDTEHMFDCQPPQEGDDAELELARHEFLEVQVSFLMHPFQSLVSHFKLRNFNVKYFQYSNHVICF